jgi:hypothetical protein
MKTLPTFLTMLAVASVSFAQAPSEDALYRKLVTRGDDSVSALKEVLTNSESVSAVPLYTASGVALREKQLEDAGYLFYVARFRAQFDKEMFPPTETGGNSPMVAFGALQQQLGGAVNPALMAEPKVFSKVLTSVKSWTPRVASTYNPGWLSSKKGSQEQAEASLQDGKKKFLEGMGGICTLLQDHAYFAAFRVGQDYNLKRGSERPSQEAYDAAMKTMERIETEKGIQGIASKRKK